MDAKRIIFFIVVLFLSGVAFYQLKNRVSHRSDDASSASSNIYQQHQRTTFLATAVHRSNDDHREEYHVPDASAPCACHPDCVQHICLRDDDGDDANAPVEAAQATMTVDDILFFRCKKCQNRGGKCKPVDRIEPTTRARPTYLSDTCKNVTMHAAALDAIDRVSQCASLLTRNLHAPNNFKLVVDHLSMRKRVACPQGDEDACSGADPELVTDEFHILANAISHMQSKKLGCSANSCRYQAVDVGILEPLLDARLAFLVGRSGAKAAAPTTTTKVVVNAFSMNRESEQLLRMTGCYNRAQDVIRVAPFRAQPGGGGAKVPGVSALKSGSEKGASVMRIQAPGYEKLVIEAFNETFADMMPTVVSTVAAPGSPSVSLFKWLRPYGYVPFHPATCQLALTEREMNKLMLKSMQQSHLLTWVAESSLDALHPRCTAACTTLSCEGGWRTQYAACPLSARCSLIGNDPEARSCGWGVAHSPCPEDTNWKRVHQCLDPNLPVPTFSVVDAMGMLVMCPGERSCDHLDTSLLEKEFRTVSGLLNSVAEQLSFENLERGGGAGRKLSFLYVGSKDFGLLPLQMMKKFKIETRVFDPFPVTRQLLHTTACFHDWARKDPSNTLKIYPYGLAATKMICNLLAVEGTNTTMHNAGCFNAAMVSESKKSDDRAAKNAYAQLFAPLDTVYETEIVARQQGDQVKERVQGSVWYFGEDSNAAQILPGARNWLSDPLWRPVFVIQRVPQDLTDVRSLQIPDLFELMQSHGYRAGYATKTGEDRSVNTAEQMEHALSGKEVRTIRFSPHKTK